MQRQQGRYVLGDLLGRGGMAEVFAGHAMGSHGFQKPVAIKRLLPELANDDVFVERLIGEAKLLVGMQHGNIVSVLDLARDGDDVFLVMEYVDGPSLRQLLRARGQRGLPLGVATYVVQSAAAGLEFAHVRPGGAVIHADISPSNLLLTTSGEVRVADFGIARREGGAGGIVEGKWAYMSPEQVRGEPLTPRCDVFALGVVLYELITGRHPFGRQVTAGDRESRPLSVVPPRNVCPDVPPGLDEICMKALAADPRERYSRMQQMIDAIVEERFSCGWRDSASDLAHLIREFTPNVTIVDVRTQISDPPVTILTRSLISQARGSTAQPRSARFAEGTKPPTAFKAGGGVLELIARGSAPMAIEAPPTEVASMHGGSQMFTGTEPMSAPDARPHKWSIAVLAIAALAGAVAAIATQLGPDDDMRVADPIQIVREAARPATAAPGRPIVTPLSPASAPAPATVAVDQVPALAPALAAAPRAKAHAASAPKHAASADAVLKVKTPDGTWAAVSIAGQPQKETPGASFHLAPGKYVVRLKNDQDGVRHCKVTVEAGRAVTLSVDMQSKGEDPCWVE
jgi:serine/threonine-protein kinase